MRIEKALGAAAVVAATLWIAGCEQKTEGGPTPARVARELENLKPAEAPATGPAGTPAAGAPAAGQAAPTAPATPEARAEADQIFASRCAACHGPQGMGDGPTAAALNPKPRNFHDKTWQGEVTDAHIQQIIVGGGMAVGKSPLMPPNPDLKDKPAVVSALREKIRAFGK
jgi:cytochrome c553